MLVELLWFDGCPNHQAAERMLRDVLAAERVDAEIVRIEVADEEIGKAECFPGSPTIRIDGRDIEPGWEPCDDCTPRCRLYLTNEGYRGLPEREWVVAAVRSATG